MRSGPCCVTSEAFPEFAELSSSAPVPAIDGPIEENVAVLRRLKGGGQPVHALSNFAWETFALVQEQYDFLRKFDTCVVSGHVGVAKPDPRIFKILFDRVGRPASDLLFIDNSIANVRASQAAGMAAIHYRPGVDLESELIARGALR